MPKPNYQKLILQELREIKELLKPEIYGKEQPSFQELLDSTKRTQYTDKDVMASVKPCQVQDIEFFTVGSYISDDNLEKEYQKRNLEAASPYALALYDIAHTEEVDDKKDVATHWKDSNGKWCYAAFSQWDDGRDMDVFRSDSGWGDSWWFAAIKK